jgi:hypothetical protein
MGLYLHACLRPHLVVLHYEGNNSLNLILTPHNMKFPYILFKCLCKFFFTLYQELIFPPYCNNAFKPGGKQ